MSEEKPNFHLDEFSLKEVNRFFEDQDRPDPKENLPKRKTPKLGLPKHPVQTKEEADIAIKAAESELFKIHTHFTEFIEAISDTMIYSFIYEDIIRLTEAFVDMESLIKNNIDESALSEKGKADYQRLLELRERVLADLYAKYNKN